MFSLKSIKRYFSKLIKILSLKELRILPAYLSYSFVLAVIPIATIIVIVAGYFSISIDSIINLINEFLPSYASDIVVGVISGKDFDISVGVLNIFTFIAAANGMYAIVSASNDLYKIENSSQIKDRFRAFIILLIIISAILFLILVPMLGDKIILLLGRYESLNKIVENILLIYIGGILVIIAGYILAVWGLSCYMKKELTNPIYMLINAFNEISTGNYSVRVDFDTVTEFVEIRDSFNGMVKRLFDMEEEKRVSYQQRQQLLTDIGHDLKTPTTIIQGYSSVVLEGRVTEEHKEKCMRIINENAANLAELTELLLDYTRFDCADYKLTLTNYDLGEFLRRIIAEKILLFEEHQINLVIDIPNRKVEAEIDFKILKRAIVNLLNNIIQHNPAGINALVCLTDQKKIIIADSGELIPEEIKDKIFDPFVCGDKARNPEKHNSGLGLSITKKIVEMHNGRLYLEQGWKEYTKAFVIDLS